jgi:hypothetical protein
VTWFTHSNNILIHVFYISISVNQLAYLNYDYWRFLHHILSYIDDSITQKHPTGRLNVVITKTPLIIPLISLAESIANEDQPTHQLIDAVAIAIECFRLLHESQHKLFKPSFEHLTTLLLNVCIIHGREDFMTDDDEGTRRMEKILIEWLVTAIKCYETAITTMTNTRKVFKANKYYYNRNIGCDSILLLTTCTSGGCTT